MSKNKPPKRARFFIADDIRLESSQKPMLLGFFPNDLVHIEMPENINPSDNSPVAIPGIAILASFLGFQGSLDMKMTIIAPNDEVLIDNESLGTLEYNEVKDHAEANIVIRLSPFVIKHLGEYKLIIRILDKPYEYKFNFEKKVIK